MAFMNQSPFSPFPERLAALRAAIKAQGLDGFLVPLSDEYLGEYVPPRARRLAFMTGFTGTYGFLAVLLDQAAFFTDSRYTLQAARQVPRELYEIFDVAQTAPTDWLTDRACAGMKIGFDPRLHSVRQIERIEAALLKRNASLAPVEENPVDPLWTDRPPALLAPIVPHETAYAGKSAAAKRAEIGAILRKKNANAAILTDPSSIAWLLNVRGGDVPLAPLPLSTAIARADGSVDWFVDPRKASASLDEAIGYEVTRHEEGDLAGALFRLGEAQSRVLLDPDKTPYFILSLLRHAGCEVERGEDPCALPKACKNETEIEGMRAAHRRDGAALVKFLAWIDSQAPEGRLSELSVEEKLLAFRAEGNLFKGPSFETIAGAGPNGAVVHYRADATSNAPVVSGSFLLVDSGGHYLDGTTDVTRTIPIGTVSAEMRDRYTRVLKGLIALASIRFPEGTTGAELDVLARQFLWAEGLDYGHGTGHGVGSYLCVHEGPQSISRRGDTPLKPGMVLSNEPGYYKAGHYGIRLENLQLVVEIAGLGDPDKKTFGFETLTLAPFDRRALAFDLLTKEERVWLNVYHARVLKTLRPQLDAQTAAWLETATAEV